jgi:hypothetical protein
MGSYPRVSDLGAVGVEGILRKVVPPSYPFKQNLAFWVTGFKGTSLIEVLGLSN